MVSVVASVDVGALVVTAECYNVERVEAMVPFPRHPTERKGTPS